MDQQAPIKEVANNAATAEYNLFGVTQQLDSVKLARCHDCTAVYQLWIMEKAENATRRNLLDTLKAIGQNDVARKYEDYLKSCIGPTSTYLCT